MAPNKIQELGCHSRSTPQALSTQNQVLSWLCFTCFSWATQSNNLEMIQKKSFAIILGSKYKSYRNALLSLSQDTLHSRRLKLCSNFAIKCTKHSRHSDLFKPNPRYTNNPRNKHKFIQPMAKTTRYYKSAVPFLTRLLNSKWHHEW